MKATSNGHAVQHGTDGLASSAATPKGIKLAKA
jgi:hypothetical protein